MARIPDVPDERSILPVNIFRAMSNAHEVARRYSALGGTLLFKGSLPAKARELVIDAISVKLDCPYEWSHHAPMALDAGAGVDELRALREGRLDALEPYDRACVEYAFKVDDREVADADVAALREAGLSDEQVTELTMLAGFYGMTARFLLAMDVRIDEGHHGFDRP